jgi:molybdopterin-guanine dinucleotide biosynthesis protein A
MGRDKAILRVANQPLWRRQAETLRAAGAEPVVVIRQPEQSILGEVEVWLDRHGAAGPLAGLHTALAPRRDARVAILAVDMPDIDARWFTDLVVRCRPEAGAVVRHDGRFEPLAAIYSAAA